MDTKKNNKNINIIDNIYNDATYSARYGLDIFLSSFDNALIELTPQCNSKYDSGGEISICVLKIAIALIFFKLFNVHNG